MRRSGIRAVLFTWVCACVVNGAHISLFFAGGQSNAEESWKIGIERALVASGEFEQVEVAWRFHQGAPLESWITGSPQEPLRQSLYKIDFYHRTSVKKEQARLQKYIRVITDRGDTYSFEGFFWLQGESNMTEDGFQDYTTRMEDLMSAIQADLGLSDFPVCMALVWQEPGKHFSSSQIPWRDALRDSMRALVERNILWSSYDTKEVPRVDGTHIAEEDLRETVGPRMVRTFLQSEGSTVILNSTKSRWAVSGHPAGIVSFNGRIVSTPRPILSPGLYLDIQSGTLIRTGRRGL